MVAIWNLKKPNQLFLTFLASKLMFLNSGFELVLMPKIAILKKYIVSWASAGRESGGPCPPLASQNSLFFYSF